MTGPMFDGTYDPAADPTVEGWGRAKDLGEADRLTPAESQIEQLEAGRHAFAAVRAGAWHKLGTIIDHPVSAEQLLNAAGGDYSIIMGEAWSRFQPTDDDGAPAGDAEWARIPNTATTNRRHPVTGKLQAFAPVSNSYQPLAAREAFLQLGDAIIDTAEPAVATAGSLYDGAVQFMSWKLPRGVLVDGQDAIDLWLMMLTSHDKRFPLTAAVVPNRAVCVNTCRYNLRNAVSRWSVRHTRHARLALQEARESLRLTWAYMDEWQREMDTLLATPVTNDQFDQIITRNFGPAPDDEISEHKANAWSAKRSAMHALFSDADTQEFGRGTAYGALQAVTELADWGLKVRSPRGFDDPDAYRLWRSMNDHVSVASPKEAMLGSLRELANI